MGLKKAGFNVVAGVELNPKVAKTYEANNPGAQLIVKDIRQVTGAEILKLTKLDSIDLVAGCPPCQGFSKLTDKYHRTDSRNGLVLEMARIIAELNPRMVMMENVPGLATRGKAILNKFMERLKAMGYCMNKDVLQMADYGVPQSRNRLVLLAGKGFEIPLPIPTYSIKGGKGGELKPWLTLEDAIKGMPNPVTLSKANSSGGPKNFNWHVISDLTELNKNRLNALNQGGSRKGLPKKLRPKCHETNDGFKNVYGRLSWTQTPPTMTSGFTRLSMGRFGHPDELRTLSVREAALIQTFPMSYKFETEFMSTACELVGNALPCVFATKVAKSCLIAFKEQCGT